MILYQFLCTENPAILTNTCSGIVITIWLPSKVSWVPLPTGLKQFVLGSDLLNKELQHLREALYKCKYPKWAIDKVLSKSLNSSWKVTPRKAPQKKGLSALMVTPWEVPSQGQIQHSTHSHPINPRFRRKH